LEPNEKILNVGNVGKLTINGEYNILHSPHSPTVANDVLYFGADDKPTLGICSAPYIRMNV
jgi:hypothetical protein